MGEQGGAGEHKRDHADSADCTASLVMTHGFPIWGRVPVGQRRRGEPGCLAGLGKRGVALVCGRLRGYFSRFVPKHIALHDRNAIRFPRRAVCLSPSCDRVRLRLDRDGLPVGDIDGLRANGR